MGRIPRLLVTVILVLFTPAFLAAQMHGGAGHYMMHPGMRDNMGMMSEMMSDMHGMLQSGQMTPEQQQQMLEMMSQMGGIMQDMEGSQGTQMEAQYQQQLNEIHKRLQDLKGRMNR